MNRPSHKTEGVNRTKTMRFHPFVSTGNDPRKGWRIPLNEIKYNEQRDEEKERSRGPFASERGDEPRSGIPYCSVYSYTYFGARYMDYELMTMWLSVDPMSDKYPSSSPYVYCAWNPVKLVDPDGRDVYVLTSDGHLRRSEKMTKECEDYKDNDVIYAQSTGEFSKKFKEGYLRDMKCGTQSGKKGSYLILGDNRQDNVDIFKFCAENAETEFSLMEFKMEDGIRTLLTTSHHERTPSSEYVSDEYGSAYAKANVCYLISHIHNHFQTVGASFDQNGNSPDIDFRTMINNIRVCGDEETKKTSVSFGIYKCRGDDKYMTDYERNKIDPITMKKIDK